MDPDRRRTGNGKRTCDADAFFTRRMCLQVHAYFEQLDEKNRPLVGTVGEQNRHQALERQVCLTIFFFIYWFNV
jgi:hypothetical protein